MNLPIAVQPERSLAAELRELALLSVAGDGACPWCGGSLSGSPTPQGWPPHTVLLCDDCRSEITLDRRLAPRGTRA